ncbi:hypothetical protein PENANT_c084G05141 [Penicillium antarcticum]|uniref:HMA domain-containing protein n=1 Tax=Penicillium antarcticum TaxID=416450 RepID=A0A1V6PP74_9EURO|nr:hypothetical protein PENANT_c084G05141 [Penicillium antarcticum]
MLPLCDSQSAPQEQGDAFGACCDHFTKENVNAAHVEPASIENDTPKSNAPSRRRRADSSNADPGRGRSEPPSGCSNSYCNYEPAAATGDNRACADACSKKDSESAPQSKGGATTYTDGCCDDEPGVVSHLAACEGNKLACNNSRGCMMPSEVSTATGEPNMADCCRGKPFPCCDESCLDRVALRECIGNTCVGETHRAPCKETSSDDRKRKACDRHRRSARDRYGTTLQALGCICRALIALGQESCCETRIKATVERKKSPKRRPTTSLARLSLDSCYATAQVTAQPRLHESSGGCRGENLAKKICCSARKSSCEKVTVAQNRPSEKILSDVTSTAKPFGGACAASCCGPGKSRVNESTSLVVANDLENQAAGSEHIVLCVSGMTCTGCETKLTRALVAVAGVKNLKTSLVLSRAEFDVELSLVSLDYVIKHLERTTEFKFETITSSGSIMEVLVPGDVSAFIDEAWPTGVTDMSPVRKETIRITFDPKLIGARNLLEKHWGNSARLAPVRPDPGLEAGRKHILHLGLVTLLSVILTIPVLVMAWAPLPKKEISFASASLALATIVQVIIAGPFYPNALKALIFSRVIEMDLLIVLSTSAAYIFSVVSFGYLVAGKPLSTGQFFETSTLLVTLIMVGRYVAALARQKAVESVSIRSLQVSNALLVDDTDGSSEREIDVRLLQYGDIFKVLPDSRIPTDGTVVAGSSDVDESMLTGESLPVEKQAQSRVIAGTVNGCGALVVRLTRLPSDNTVTAIAAMVDEAKLSKPRLQELADKVASYFVPVVITLTIIVFVIWVSVGIAIRGKSGSAATVDAITYAITVLIVSCPCAIGLAVPMVVVIASGVAAECGVIFKSSSAIEVAYKTSHVIFDKTGTLTQGKLTVVSEHCVSNNDSTLRLLLGLIGDNRHPVSIAVTDHLRRKGVMAAVVPGAKSLIGRGLEAQVAGQALRAGNSGWLCLSSDATVQSVLAQNHTAFCFAIDGALAAVFGLEDSMRADAARVVLDLQKRSVSVHLVSGDDDGPVKNVAAKLNIPGSLTQSRSSPADKQAYINDLLDHSEKGKKPIVMFCGDGTNDAVALAQATIGVHMNEGSDIAQSAADVILMRPELAGILTIMNTSNRSVNRIKFNFVWSIVYNTFAVLLAAGAFVSARIPPEFAGLGELVSVLPVIAAAVLLRWPRDSL